MGVLCTRHVVPGQRWPGFLEWPQDPTPALLAHMVALAILASPSLRERQGLVEEVQARIADA